MPTYYMSVGFDRLIRMIRYDPYLPMKCFARTTSRFSYCDCLIACKYRESKPSRDYRNSQSGKDPQSQGHKGGRS
jgi:hypothetical protein